MKVLICGGGVIGACIAFFLGRSGADAIVVERTGIACAASSKSGGFLALDWCDGTPLETLARRSFALHERLAGDLRGETGGWGYRRVTTYAGTSGDAAWPAGGTLPWLSERVAIGERIGTPETTAQVDPGRFTGAVMRAAEARGARLLMGEVTGLVREGGRVRGAIVDGEAVTADAVVIAMGPWSMRACEWLPLPPVSGLKGHSIVFETGNTVPAEALFLEHREADGRHSSPEIYPRDDGTTYVCALSTETPLPADPAAVGPDPGAADRLQAICGALSPVLADSPVLVRQACHRPITRDGLPLIGAVPGVEGAYVATGHGAWGILNAPATGEAIAELVLDGAATLDLSPFEPGRLPPAR